MSGFKPHVILNSAGIEPQCRRWLLLGTTSSRGLNQSTLPKEELLDLEVALPSLEEQRRISKTLDHVAVRLDDTRARLETIPAILKRFRRSVLAAACSGRLTDDWRGHNNLPNWVTATLADVIQGKPKNGYSAKPVNHKTPWRVLTLDDGVAPFFTCMVQDG